MYLALPWQVVLLVPAAVQRDQKVCARVSIGERQAGGAHLLAGGLCAARQCPASSRYCSQWEAGHCQHALWSLRPTAFFSVSVTVMVAAGGGSLQWRAGGVYAVLR